MEKLDLKEITSSIFSNVSNVDSRSYDHVSESVYLSRALEKSEFKNDLIPYLRSFDFGIEDFAQDESFKIQFDNGTTQQIIGFKHANDGQSFSLSAIDESAGTVKGIFLLLNLIRVGTGDRITPLAVSSPFDYAESTLLEFGVSVQKSNSNAIVFDKVDLEKPFITQNNVMWQYLESQLNHQLELLNRDNSFSQHDQQTLFSALPRGHFQIEDVAIDLGVSVRTLQRISQQN